MRKRILPAIALFALAFAVPLTASAASNEADVLRLSAQLEQLSADPTLGGLALGEQARARDAIAQLGQAGRREHDHALFIAEQRVALARAAARTEAEQRTLDQLDREHDRIMLEASQADAATARAELARQRLQYQAAVEQAQMLQQQGAQYSQQAQQAQLQVQQAQQLAAAQGKAAALAKREADLAEAATRALRGGDASAAGAAKSAGSISLPDGAFHAGTAELSASRVRKLAEFAQAHAGQSIRIVPHAGGGMRVLAGRRAVAVRDALVAGGADAARIRIRPVAGGGSGANVDVSAG
ncbi:MAG: hypothetical protein ABI132_03270 [Rhodanobacteraceae bacterium]